MEMLYAAKLEYYRSRALFLIFSKFLENVKSYFVKSFHLLLILGSSESNSMWMKAKSSKRKTITSSIKPNKGCYVYNNSKQHSTEAKNDKGKNVRMMKSKQTTSSDDKTIAQNRNGNQTHDYHDNKTNDTNIATTILEENNEDTAVPDGYASTNSDTTKFSRFNVKTEIDVVEHITEASIIIPIVTLENQNELMNTKLR